MEVSLGCRSQRGHCPTAAHWASLAWPEASRSPSTVGPACTVTQTSVIGVAPPARGGSQHLCANKRRLFIPFGRL